eukprot:GILK01009875.1.p1 GENE.GILK01009875.1~~GILK01009875.1.p1  ORF type:complete len:198 (-),score=20.28 GILK01009875.1:103-696(-)
MFVLTEIRDTIAVAPDQLGKDQVQVLTELIQCKYVDRVIPNVGLGVELFDFLKIGDGFIYTGDARSHVEVDFRLVVLRPFIGEVLVGKILHSDPEGLRVTLGFFDDVFIPYSLLKQPCLFDERDSTWVWKYDDHDLFFDRNEEIRFRVRSLQFSSARFNRTALQLGTDEAVAFEDQIPMRIIAGCDEDGLGLTSWWS